MLKHHGKFGAADLPQAVSGDVRDILVVYDHLAGGGFNKPIDTADKRGFAGTGKAHDHEDLTLSHLK